MTLFYYRPLLSNGLMSTLARISGPRSSAVAPYRRCTFCNPRKSRKISGPAGPVKRCALPEDEEPNQPNIDELASFLTQRAAQMRASMDELDLPLDAEPFLEPSPSSTVSSGHVSSYQCGPLQP